MNTISYEQLTIAVKDHGAELASIKSNGREYLWQADEKFWKRHSPVLFPIVGAVWDGEYRSHGNTYKMGQHGFARDMDFTLISETDNELRYELVSTEETLQKYPYPFRLEIGYRLNGNRITVMWHVENTGTEAMAFQIGAHPAFFWPEDITDDNDLFGYFKIESNVNPMPLSVITEKGCVGAISEVTLDSDGYIELNAHTFDNDALIIEDSHVTKVTLCDSNKNPYLAMEFTSPLVGLWSPPKKRAPFVCIEPWYGRTDPANYDGLYEQKPWIQHLAPNAAFNAEYTIVIC